MNLTKLGLVVSLILSCGSLAAGDKSSAIGVVDFAKCISNSKIGKTEADNFEALRTQMQGAIEDLDKQLKETANQLQNPDLLDSLSPEAEQELKVKFQTLNEELQRYQQQSYQIMQQANMKLIQAVSSEINAASEVIAKKDKLALVINKEAAFHYGPNLEVTDSVIAEMDKKFEKTAKSNEGKK